MKTLGDTARLEHRWKPHGQKHCTQSEPSPYLRTPLPLCPTLKRTASRPTAAFRVCSKPQPGGDAVARLVGRLIAPSIHLIFATGAYAAQRKSDQLNQLFCCGERLPENRA